MRKCLSLDAAASASLKFPHINPAAETTFGAPAIEAEDGFAGQPVMSFPLSDKIFRLHPSAESIDARAGNTRNCLRSWLHSAENAAKARRSKVIAGRNFVASDPELWCRVANAGGLRKI